MSPVEILFLVLAAFSAWIIYTVVIVPLVSLSKKIADSSVINNAVLSLVSFQWKFVEEIEEELFSSVDERVQHTLRRVLGEHFEDKKYRVSLTIQMLNVLIVGGVCQHRQLAYTRRSLKECPHFFTSLPGWRRLTCEEELSEISSCGDEEIINVTTRIGFGGAEIVVVMPVQAQDYGPSLFQVKKIPGGERVPPRENEQTQGLSLSPT